MIFFFYWAIKQVAKILCFSILYIIKILKKTKNQRPMMNTVLRL